MKLNDIVDYQNNKDRVCWRKMKVESGYLYNFWNYNKDDYNEEWIFIPNNVTNHEVKLT